MEEDEEDIWEEKSLRKLKGSKKNLSPIRKACNKSSKRLSKNVGAQDTESGQEGPKSSNRKQLKRKRTGSSTYNSRRKQQKSPVSTRATPQKTSITDGFCPKCQMPFCAIIGQSPGWHVRECLEAKYSYIGKVMFERFLRNNVSLLGSEGQNKINIYSHEICTNPGGGGLLYGTDGDARRKF